MAAVFGLSGQVRNLIQPHIGAAHAGVVRYALVLAGIFTVLLVALNVSSLPVGQLVLGGAVTGVLLGIAAQQSLANLFAGMVLLFARPFRVGDRVRFRAGALGGSLEGTVTDISITYVRLETADGVVFVPNSQALAATVGPLPPPAPAEPAPGRRARPVDRCRRRCRSRARAGARAGGAVPAAPGGAGSSLVTRVVLGDHLGRDAAPITHLDAAALGPRANVSTALTVRRGPALRAAYPAGNPARLLREARQSLIELLTVLLA